MSGSALTEEAFADTVDYALLRGFLCGVLYAGIALFITLLNFHYYHGMRVFP